MRRALIIAVVLLLAMASPASAATTVVVARTFPAELRIEDYYCSGSQNFILAEPKTVQGPDTPPSGGGSLQVSVDSLQMKVIRMTGVDLSGLSRWSVWAHPDNTAVGALILTPNYALEADNIGGTDGAWSSVDMASLTYDVYPSQSNTKVATSTIPGFLADHPTETDANLLLLADTCDHGVPGSAYFDLFSVADTTSSGAADVTVDFEPNFTSLTPAAAQPGTITAGGSTTLSTALSDRAAPVAGATVRLMAKAYGASSFTRVLSAVTGANGVVVGTVKPQRRTTYYWDYAGGAGHPAGRSKPITVVVRAKVTISAKAALVGGHQAVVASGVVGAAHAGTVVTLWRTTRQGKEKLGTAKETRSGSYRIAKVLPRGTYRVFTTVPAVAGDLAGTSPTVKVVIG